MIKSLRLANFRRHAELDLRFDETGQIILIAGANGVGKTTILEGIIYSLYGEGRHGRRNLDSLLRRGAELEGMETEMVFTVGDDTYRVLRRRDGRASTAVLYANDHPLVEGQREVSDEITRVLGMDAAGFRLATIAQQKDLDGLASLTPSVRTKMVGRLLRLDSLTRARDAAGELHLNEARVAAGLRPVEALDAVVQRRTEALAQLENADQELERALSAVSEAAAQIEESGPVVTAWQDCQSLLTVRSAELAVGEANRDRLAADLEALTIPDLPQVAPEDLSVLTREVAQVERDLAEAEAAATTMEHRRLLSNELVLVEDALLVLREGSVEEANKVLELARQSAEEAQLSLQGFEDRLRIARDELSGTNYQVSAARTRRSRNEELEPVCESCGQEVADDHRAAQAGRISSEIDDLLKTLRSQEDLVSELTAAASTWRTGLDEANLHVARCAQDQQAAVAAERERLELTRRRDTYRDQLIRLPERSVDLDPLYARKAELALRVAATQDLADRERLRAEVLSRRTQLQEALEIAQSRLLAAVAALADSEPSAALAEAFSGVSRLQDSLANEQEIAQHWRTERAVVAERVVSADAAMARATSEEERRRLHQELAFDAGNAKRLLNDVAERLATTVRPSLEGAVSHLLQNMSEGRFNKVRIGEDYEISVEDDGAFRPVGELSGGEADLIALALRLALAQIVAERHGSGGAGFLILDEPLGSQDPARRAAIMRGLRAIRDTYSQIFLISHVDGIDDSADTVVNVLATEDRTETLVEVS